MPLAEFGDRPIVRGRASGQPPKGDIIDASAFDHPRRAHSGGVGVQQERHQPRIVGRPTARLGVRSPNADKIQMLVDQLGNEPGQVLRRQAVIQRRRRQSMIGPNTRTSCSAGNFGLAELGVCALSKTYLEQLAISELISRPSFRAPTLNPITPPGVLPTQAGRRHRQQTRALRPQAWRSRSDGLGRVTSRCSASSPSAAGRSPPPPSPHSFLWAGSRSRSDPGWSSNHLRHNGSRCHAALDLTRSKFQLRCLVSAQ